MDPNLIIVGIDVVFALLILPFFRISELKNKIKTCQDGFENTIKELFNPYLEYFSSEVYRILTVAFREKFILKEDSIAPPETDLLEVLNQKKNKAFKKDYFYLNRASKLFYFYKYYRRFTILYSSMKFTTISILIYIVCGLILYGCQLGFNFRFLQDNVKLYTGLLLIISGIYIGNFILYFVFSHIYEKNNEI